MTESTRLHARQTTTTADPLRELPPDGRDTGRSGIDSPSSHRNDTKHVEDAAGVVDQPGPKTTIDETVCDVLETISERPQHDPKTGRFLPGNTAAGKTLKRSETFWQAVESAKRELVERLQSDLALDGQAPATLEGLTDAYAEARLLRHAMFTRLVEMGGPITTKGRTRSLFTSYLSTLDREVRLATTLGLERRSKPVDPLDAVAEAVREANE